MQSLKILALTFSVFMSCCSSLFGQTNPKYEKIDALIESKTMLNSIKALKLLKAHGDSLDSEYWLRYSKASYIIYKYEDSKSAINKAIKLTPSNSLYHFEKGLLLNQLHELEASLISLDQAVGLKPEGEYYYWRGIVNQQLRKMSEAENDYESALKKEFEATGLRNNFAIILMEQGKFEKSLEQINKAIELDSSYSQAYSARSRINFFLFNMEAACKDRSRAIKLGYNQAFEIPDSVCNGTKETQLLFAANMYAYSNLYSLAIKSYTSLVKQNYIQSVVYLNRGYCYYQLKKYKKAEKDYLKALEFPNALKDLLFDNLALLYFDQNKFEKSLDYSSKRIELNPENHVPYLDRGLCYRKLKKYEEAERDFNTSLEIKPDFFRAFAYRAFLYLELEQYQKAYEGALKSVSINPEYGYGYMVLAQVKQQLGLPDFCKDYNLARKYKAPDGERAVKLYCD